jgi:CheY-like chemotaxis protein
MFELEPGEELEPETPCPACSNVALLADEGFQFSGDGKWAVRSLRQIHRAGSHLLSLINDVLDLSKLEAGRMRLTLEWLEVRAVLQNVIETLEPVAESRQQRLVLDVKDGLPLQADSVKVSQIFINLVGNALKFSPDGGEVRVGAEQRGDSWVFWVQDRGIGIAPENHALIFESFRQVDGSNTRKFGGSGLGLTITRKLAEAHFGRVWVESELGKGSTFFVELPREGPSETASYSLLVPPATTGKVILILDDERFAAENLKSGLTPLGHRVECIQDPRLLDQALTQHQPDLLVLDVMMPGVSGLDVLRQLKARQVAIPVLVSSAYHANVEVVRALGASWLAKPWRTDELQAEVTRLLLLSQIEQTPLNVKTG